MSDRCNVRLHIHKDEIDTVLAACSLKRDEAVIEFGEFGATLKGGGSSRCRVLWFEELNYGHSEELRTAAAAGCVFRGFHTPGIEYPAYVFAAACGEYAEAAADREDEWPVVRYSCPDEPKLEDLTHVREYYRILAIVQEHLGPRA